MQPKAVREALGLNITEMARLCDVHFMTWSKWEKGERRPPAAARRLFQVLLWLNKEGLLQRAVRDMEGAA